MSTDREVADMIRTSVGYKTTVGPTDKKKVESARIGVRTPRPSSKLGRAAWELYLRQPPPPVPSPSPLAAVWRADGIYTTALGNFDGLRRNPAKQAGFTVVNVQLLHAVYGAANESHIPIFRQEGWTVCGWGTFGQGSDPTQDGQDAAAVCKRLGLAGWKANGETWAEWDNSWKTQAFLNGWNAGGAPCPLGWSVLSSDTANYARAFAYDVALSSPGADIDIQVYGATHATYTVGAGLGMLDKAGVPVSRTTMTFDITQDGTGPFDDYRTWPGPRRVWVGEWSTADTYRQLAR